MNSSIVIDCIIVAGCAILGFVPFDKKRVRVGWAKLAFGIIAVIGVASGFARLAWDAGWFSVSSKVGYRLDATIYQVHGVILGILFSLILSGQLTGAKRQS